MEILEQQEWPGKYIPIGCGFGRELWVDTGSGTERVFKSLTRGAQGAQMLYNYNRSTQAELVGQIPKNPWVVIAGQLAGFEEDWQNAAVVPTTFLQYHAVMDATGNTLLPAPQRANYEPAIQALEILAESSRQDVRNAMGISSLPTAASRLNEKSGVALERIQQQSEVGTYHFIDNYERFLDFMGRCINDLIPYFYDTPREVALRAADGSTRLGKINQPYKDDAGNDKHHVMTQGDYDVTISTGPSHDSQREKADEFASSMVSPELMAMAIQGNTTAKKIVSLSIKLQKTSNSPQQKMFTQ